MRRTWILLLLVIGAVMFGSSCVTAEELFRKNGLKRAAFDLDCSEKNVEYTVLERNDGLGCVGSQMGAVCTENDKEATYVCVTGNKWVMDSDSDS